MLRPSSNGRGAQAGDALDRDALLACIPPDVATRIDRLSVFASLDSTNRYLLEASAPRGGMLHVALADHQHAGRGRRGRHWIAPPGAGLCLSAAFWVRRAPRGLVALPLAAGVVIRRAIVAAAGIEIALKWPNDLVWTGRKLGGILVEQAAGSADGAQVVIGVGINVAMPTALRATLSDWPSGAVDLAEATGGRPPTRIVLAAATIAALAELATRFEREGFAAYRSEFAAADALADRAVHIVDDRAMLMGVARGVDALGALIVEAPDGSRRHVFSGDVSVRPVEDPAVTQ